VGVILCSTFCYTAPASACAGPECTAPVRLPALTSMPGNLVYFQVFPEDPGVLTLRTAGGEPIAASIQTLGADRVFAPEAAIPANTDVVLEYRESCFDGPASATSSFAFATTEAAAVELRPAQLTLEEKGVLYANRQVTAVFVRLRHLNPVANAAGLPLLDTQAWVDGEHAQQIQSAELELVAPCPSLSGLDIDSCNPPILLDPGVHSVEVRSHLVGQTTQPEPARLEVDLRCPASPVPPVTGHDAGAIDAGNTTSTVDTGAREDAGAASAQEPADHDLSPPAPAPVSSHRGSECGLYPPEPSGRAPLLAGGSLALAALALARRRRRAE
jgi:hypothetical protein